MRRFPDRRDGWYYLPGDDGRLVKLPSVTTVLSILAKPQLVRWAAREVARAILEDPDRYSTVEAAAAVPFQRQTEASTLGRDVHRAIEAWSRGEPVVSRDDGYMAAFRRFLAVCQPVVMYPEATVFSLRHGYAGTTDLICQMGGETWILDFKTSKAVYYEYHLQTEAYRNCEWLKTDDGRIVEKPEVQRTGVVLLRPEGTYEFTETRGDFELFLHLLGAYRRLKEVGQL